MYKFFLILFTITSFTAKAQEDLPHMLLLDEKVQVEATDAVNDMYNFKFDKAEKQFQVLKVKYPEHPLPYFLMGLSTWWKMYPNLEVEKKTEKYDAPFVAYMDTAIKYAEKLYDANEKNYEAIFFLAGAYGFKAHLYGERKKFGKATFAARSALIYLRKNIENEELSPEFLFGDALYNYYAEWIRENYPLLRPILIFFKSGDKALGIKQLRQVSYNAFYTRTEAQYYLMRIYKDEDMSDKALTVARYLATTFPDNGYFERYYAQLCYLTGQNREAETVCLDILKKLELGMPGYEEISGRYAGFILGFIYQYRDNNLPKAKLYYQKAVKYTELIDEVKQGYYLNSLANLARIADKEGDKQTARQYYKTLLKHAGDEHEDLHDEAKTYLKTNKRLKNSKDKELLKESA